MAEPTLCEFWTNTSSIFRSTVRFWRHRGMIWIKCVNNTSMPPTSLLSWKKVVKLLIWYLIYKTQTLKNKSWKNVTSKISLRNFIDWICACVIDDEDDAGCEIQWMIACRGDSVLSSGIWVSSSWIPCFSNNCTSLWRVWLLQQNAFNNSKI